MIDRDYISILSIYSDQPLLAQRFHDPCSNQCTWNVGTYDLIDAPLAISRNIFPWTNTQ